MKKVLVFVVIGFFTILLAGCSEQPTVILKDQEDIKESEQVKKADEEVVDKEEIAVKEEMNSWEGEWIFLSDDNLGQLRIEKIAENQIHYHLGGTRINPHNMSSYANSFEGTGMIEGNRVTFTNDYVEDCGGVMVKNGDIVTVTTENDSCHTPQVYLNGDYQKTSSIETQESFIIQDDKFFLYGITLGDLPSDVKSLNGNPIYEGPDEEGFYEWVQKYDEKNIFVSYYSNQVESVNVEVPFSVLQTKVSNHENIEMYITDDGAEYLYNPSSKQLLIYHKKEDEDLASVLFTYADNNFLYGVEAGWIKKIN